jgi:tetratricopeptide (TPR) repeat protein
MLDVARATGARYALLGSAVRSGPELRFTAHVYDVAKSMNLGTARAEGPADSLLAWVDQFSIEVWAALPWGSAQGPRPRPPTHCLPCLKAWLDGEAALRRSDFDHAADAYRHAVELDSTFALAFYRLATASGYTEELRTSCEDRAFVERAARLADRLTERVALLVGAKLAFCRGTLDGLAPLQQAVEKHPDDPEAWYLLGETSFHLGRQALSSQDDNDEAFDKSIELDPSFAPAYIHLIENAFNYHADSARAAQLVETYERLTAGSESARLSRLASALAFGDPASRSSALAALDTLPARALMSIALHLWHPSFGAAQERVLVAARRPDGHEAADAAVLLFLNAFLRGKLQSALGYLDDPRMPGGYRAAGVYIPFMAKLPVVSSDRLDRELVLGAADSFPYLRTFYAGAYAADRKRWPDHRTAVRRLRSEAKQQLGEGDSTEAGFTSSMALALEGYGLKKNDQEEEAIRILTAAQRQATALGPLEVVNATIRFWLSQLLVERGRFGEAEVYARSFWQDPLAAFSLAQVYENLEEYPKARAEYEFFVQGWQEADSDLQPLVEQARRSVARLRSIIGEQALSSDARDEPRLADSPRS